MYVQVYLFIILYSYWIATNIIQYLLYLVMLVYGLYTHENVDIYGGPLKRNG